MEAGIGGKLPVCTLNLPHNYSGIVALVKHCAWLSSQLKTNDNWEL
jgi:hypothetical protein